MLLAGRLDAVEAFQHCLHGIGERGQRCLPHGLRASSHAIKRSRRHRLPFGPPVPLMFRSGGGRRPADKSRWTCLSDVDSKRVMPAMSRYSGATVGGDSVSLVGTIVLSSAIRGSRV